MNFLTALHTDVGLRKKTNQDSALILQADTGAGPVLMASICDGMGGLAKGEVASAAMIRALDSWFRDELPTMLANGFTAEALRTSWENLVQETAVRIDSYGSRVHLELGTTMTVLLFVGDFYYIMNVGDSRVYMITDQAYQLTKDHTYVQREIDLGHMTPERAAQSPQRNVLLQCIGVVSLIQPDYFCGTAAPGQTYMLCCDGFRHVVTPQEFYQNTNASAAPGQADMQSSLVRLVELNKARGEVDNITAILVRTC